MYILIVGGGKIGESLARTLFKANHSIAIIEKDESIAKRLAEELSDALIIAGDGCDPRRLEDAGIEKAKVVVAATGDDEDNLIIAQLAKESFHIPRVVARVNNHKNEQIFQALDIDAVSVTPIISKLIEEEATVGDIITLLALKKGKLAIVEVDLTPESPAVNHPVKDLKLPSDCILASIIRGEQAIFPKGETILQSEDSIIALTSPKHEKDLKKILLGK